MIYLFTDILYSLHNLLHLAQNQQPLNLQELIYNMSRSDFQSSLLQVVVMHKFFHGT